MKKLFSLLLFLFLLPSLADAQIRFRKEQQHADTLYTSSSATSVTGLWTFSGGITVATGTAFFDDSIFILRDEADNSKHAQFQVSGITTGTTRTFTFPDADGTFLYSGGPLGTPASANLTNGTAFPVAQLNGLAAGVADFLGTSTSANLKTAVADGTGTGVLVFGTAPTFTTSIIAPLVIGGTAAGSTLTMKTTTGAGTTGADFIVQTGNNGATEAFRILNSGNINVGSGTNAGRFHLFQVADGNDQGYYLTATTGATATVRLFHDGTNGILGEGSLKTVVLNNEGNAGLGTIVGTNAGLGDLVLPNNTGEIRHVNAAGNDTYASVTMDSSDDIIYGNTTTPQRIRTSLGTPGNLGNGDWWAECSGTTPTRVCSFNIYDGSATRILAQIVY